MSGSRQAIWFLARRLGTALLTVLGLVTLVFAMIKLIPGDEAQVAAGDGATPAQVERTRAQLGLDAPAIVQYFRYLGRLVHGDLGTSTATRHPVLGDVLAVLPATAELVLLALLLALLVALPAAMFAALRHGAATDAVSRILVVITAGLPTFWLGLLLQWLLGTKLEMLPISGRFSAGVEVPTRTGMAMLDALLAGDLYAFYDALQHFVLPASVLAVPVAAQLFRLLRAELLTVLAREHITVARAKGVPMRRLVRGHAVPNAMGPVLTLTGIEVGILVGSAVLVESIFGLSGVGAYLQNAVEQRDIFAVLGTVTAIGVLVVLANLVTDVVQLVRDPRLRSTRMGG
ncbi:ABC transporter permease [Saccharopolyspora shandongensis]|uniref:ABC transporter permease n=1 Tax=Saccharopolyspora shandongensis TaxID=418495 RepID=UPI00340049A9